MSAWDYFCSRLAWLLPRRVVHYAAARDWAFHVVRERRVPPLTIDEVIRRWEVVERR